MSRRSIIRRGKFSDIDPSDYAGVLLMIDGLGEGPDSFWDIGHQFAAIRTDFLVFESSHQRQDFWTVSERFYAEQKLVYAAGHSLGGSIIGPLSSWTPLNRAVGLDCVWPNWSRRPVEVRLSTPAELKNTDLEGVVCSAISFTREQGDDDDNQPGFIMPGVAFAVWPTWEIDGSDHNSIIEMVSEKSIEFLTAP